MQTFALVLGILFMVGGIIVSIALHELGHLIPAKKFSCLVSEYMVGFGPTLYLGKKSRQIKARLDRKKADSAPVEEVETIYGIKAILLGGYCKILGMYRPPSSAEVMRAEYLQSLTDEADRAADSSVKVTDIAEQSGEKSEKTSEATQLSENNFPGEKTKSKVSLSEDARIAEYEQLLHYTRGNKKLLNRAFYRLSTGKKLVVMLGGITMNLFLAALFLFISMSVIGGLAPSTTLGGVSCGSANTQHTCSAQELENKDSGLSPAAQAGLLPGDKILSWGGKKVEKWQELTEQVAIQQQEAKPVIVEVERAGKTLNLQMPVFTGKAGIISHLEWQRASIRETASAYGEMFTGTVKVVFRLPQAVWSVGYDLFTGSERSTDGVMSIVGVGRIAGEVASAPNPEFSLWARIGVLFSLLASLNMALAVFNLIPLPPLDGGHVVVALWQGLRNTWARLRHKALPEPSDASGLVPLTYVVAVLLIAMSIFLIGADIISPVRLH